MQSCTNLENLISKKDKVPSMAKNLSVTTSISDLENYLSDLHGSCGTFRTKLDFLPRHILFIYLFGIFWPNLIQPSMDYDNLDFVNPKEEGVASIDEEEREEERARCGERSRCKLSPTPWSCWWWWQRRFTLGSNNMVNPAGPSWYILIYTTFSFCRFISLSFFSQKRRSFKCDSVQEVTLSSSIIHSPTCG